VRGWIRISAFVAIPALLVTAIGAVLAQRRPGHFKDTFESQWDAILGSVTLLIIGVIGLVFGLSLCLAVLGAYQADNVRRGLVLAALGLVVALVGATLLWMVLVP
jgi:cellobiose-specific phosphotransferase system component IIC